MLSQLNKMLEKLMPFITPVSLLIGVLIGSSLSHYTFLIPWLFALMTFAGSLNSNFQQLNATIHRPFPIFMALFVLHIFMPAWAWSVGQVIFPHDVFTSTGLLLAAIIPTGVTSFIWISIYKGSIPLALSIILIDTLLAPLIVPYTLLLVVGDTVHLEALKLVKDLCFMIVLPSLLGMCLNQYTKGTIKQTLGPKLAPVSKIGLSVMVMINGGVIAPYLKHIDKKLLFIIVIVFLMSSAGYFFSWMIGKWLKWDRAKVVTLTFCGGMRNISAGAVLAVSYFPAPVAVPVVLGMLFQQVLAALSGRLVQNYYQKKDAEFVSLK